MVQYRTSPDSDWEKVEVISRGGKVRGQHWHFLNVKPVDGSNDDVKHVSFRDEIHEWKCCEDHSSTSHDAFADESSQTDSGTTSVFYGSHTANSRFFQAKLDELAKWKSMGTYREVAFNNQCLISTTWVCTEKLKNGALVCKARLVARGFEEDSTHLQKESPTCTKDSLRTVLSVIVSNGWVVKSMDIKSAFLQGMKLSRAVFIKPPPEAKAKGVVWELIHAVYGLNDASRHWYDKVKSELLNLGVCVSKLDPGLFFFVVDGKLNGVLVVHVDDFLHAGTALFHDRVIKKLYEVFIVGSDATQCMKFLGYDLVQN